MLNESHEHVIGDLRSHEDASFHDMESNSSLGLMIDEWFDARVKYLMRNC